MSEWYYAKEGKQEGPVSAEQINALVAQGSLNPQSDLVWKEGQADWISVQASGVLTQSLTSNIPAPTLRPVGQGTMVATPAPAPAPVPASAAMNPYSAPVAHATAAIYDYNNDYPGIGRLKYFLWHLGLTFAVFLVLGVGFAVLFNAKVVGSNSTIIPLVLISGTIAAIPFIVLSVKRLQNLGMSGWCFLFFLIPLVNIWLNWRMIACPAGYADHKQLDTPGKVITWIMVGLFALDIVMLIFGGLMSAAQS